ncbi:MAG TPA: adenosine deaminase [Chloroflexota bacterium]|nr:adenosine deaminase [Chloroflexota bacterium]
MPKAELHLHFQGSIRPPTLLALAQRNRIDLPADDLDGLRRWFHFRDFAHFVEVYATLRACLVNAADYELVTHELGAELAAQDIRYAEVTVTPGPEVYRGLREAFFDGLTRGRQRVRQEFNVELRWIFDIPRRTVTLYPDLPLADFITSMAIDGKNDGVVALGLAGTERGYPPEPFEPWFDRARAAGLHSTPHAGETAGPASIWGALNALGAERLGHGVRAIEDPTLVRHLVEHGIPLEVCPTSNIELGVYPSLAEHPLAQLYAAGVRVTVNTDTPAIFETSLTHEIGLLSTHFGLPDAAVQEIVDNAFEVSFLSPAERELLRR